MIGVSVVLAVVNFVGWHFPNTWNVFGAQLDASPFAVEAALWIVLIYLCWEYWINIKSKVDGFRRFFADTFFGFRRNDVLNYYKNKYATEQSKSDQALKHTGTRWNEFFVWDISGNIGLPTRLGRIVNIVVTFGVKNGTGAGRNVPDEDYELDYFKWIGTTMRTWGRMLSNDDFFENIFPVAFPLSAVIAKGVDIYYRFF